MARDISKKANERGEGNKAELLANADRRLKTLTANVDELALTSAQKSKLTAAREKVEALRKAFTEDEVQPAATEAQKALDELEAALGS